MTLTEIGLPTIAPASDDPYLTGSYAPVLTEIDTELSVIGELPADLTGTFVRTGSNPRFTPKGRYHWFDGDGMLHATAFDGGATPPRYRNRWVRTESFVAEDEPQRCLAGGILEPPDFHRPSGPYKDTGNTDLVVHDGRLLALWWLSGKAHQIDLPSLDTVGVHDFRGSLRSNIAAHAKSDTATGDLCFIDYSPLPPYLRYGVAGDDGRVDHLVDIELDGPRLQHDIAITPNYSLLFDMSMMWDPDALARAKVRLRFFRDVPSRIGVIPRRGGNADVRWFEVEPFFCYHTIAAWEEGTEVVLVGCRIDEPFGAEGDGLPPAPRIANLRLEPYLWEWRLDLATGVACERQLDDTMTEFPRINDHALTAPDGARFAYAPVVAPEIPTLQFEGMIKYDVRTGTHLDRFTYPAGWFGGETCFAPADGATAEDDGYVLTYGAELATGNSELWVFDARSVGDGPMARLPIPQRVPTGYHTRWVPQ